MVIKKGNDMLYWIKKCLLLLMLVPLFLSCVACQTNAPAKTSVKAEVQQLTCSPKCTGCQRCEKGQCVGDAAYHDCPLYNACGEEIGTQKKCGACPERPSCHECQNCINGTCVGPAKYKTCLDYDECGLAITPHKACSCRDDDE